MKESEVLRLEKTNQFIEAIASCGRKFFDYQVVGQFEIEKD